jgi:cation transport ATPase
MSVMVGLGKGNLSVDQKCEALENMNKVNVLITDKTGTITENLRLKKYLQFRIMKRTCCNIAESIQRASFGASRC